MQQGNAGKFALLRRKILRKNGGFALKLQIMKLSLKKFCTQITEACTSNAENCPENAENCTENTEICPENAENCTENAENCTEMQEITLKMKKIAVLLFFTRLKICNQSAVYTAFPTQIFLR